MASQDDRDRGGTEAGLKHNEEQGRQAAAGRASERRVGSVKAQAQTVVGATLEKRDVDSA